MGRHFLSLEGARTIFKSILSTTRRAVADIVEARAMGAVHGEARLGKTYAVEEATAGLV